MEKTLKALQEYTHTHTHTLCLLNKKEEQNDIIYKYKKIVMKV